FCRTAGACCRYLLPVAHGASEALAGALCPFASANPTDMAVTSNAIPNVLSIVSSSLLFAMKLYMSNNTDAKALDLGFSRNRLGHAAAVLLCAATGRSL